MRSIEALRALHPEVEPRQPGEAKVEPERDRDSIVASKEDLKNAFGQMHIRCQDVHLQGFVWFDPRKPLPDHIMRGEGLRETDELFVLFNLRFVFGTIESVSNFFRLGMGMRFLYLLDTTEDVDGNLLQPVIAMTDYDCSTFFDDNLLVGLEKDNPIGSSFGKCAVRFMNLVSRRCIGASINMLKREPDAITGNEKDYLSIVIDIKRKIKKLTPMRIKLMGEMLDGILARGATSFGQMRSVDGSFTWAGQCSEHMWPFQKRMRAFCKKHRNCPKLKTFRMPRGLRIDLNTIRNRWAAWNGVQYLPSDKWKTMISLGQRQDSSLKGYGAINIKRAEYFYGVWDTRAALELDISPLELVVVIMGIETWAEDFYRQSVIVECDNESCVNLMNTKRGLAPSMGVGARTLCLLLDRVSGRIGGIHRGTKINVCSDAASRDFDEDTFWAEAIKYHPKVAWKEVQINKKLMNHLTYRMRRANLKATRPGVN
jgi:hypothetical protein